MSEFNMDWDRERRTGAAEAVLCDGKRPDQIAAIVRNGAAEGRRLLLTRLDPEIAAALPDAARLDYEPVGRTGILGGIAGDLRPGAGIVTGGSSDLGVATEAARTLAFHGHAAPIVADVGVAGLWRLLDRIEEIRAFRVIIAVAGMEGALFSVLTGLVHAPVIALPSPCGYGVAQDGAAALTSALASCAAGLTVVNTGNGFGAACAAIRILRMVREDGDGAG